MGKLRNTVYYSASQKLNESWKFFNEHRVKINILGDFMKYSYQDWSMPTSAIGIADKDAPVIADKTAHFYK